MKLRGCLAFFTGLALLFAVGCSGSKAPSSSRTEIPQPEKAGLALLEGKAAKNIRDFGAAGDGTTDDTEALKQAVEQTPADGALVFQKGTYWLSSDVQFKADVLYFFENGAKLTMASGAALTVDGTVSAPVQTIFEGTVKGHLPQAYVQWFGATGNPMGDDTAAFQAAIDCADTVLVPVSTSQDPTTYTYGVGELTFTRPVALKGVGEPLIPLKALSKTGALFRIASSGVTIENFKLNCASARQSDATSAVCFDVSDGDLHSITLTDLTIISPYTGLIDRGDGAITKTRLTNVSVYSALDIGIHMTRFLSEIEMSHVAVYTSLNRPGFLIENTKGLTMQDCDTNGGFTPGGEAGGDCFIFQNCENVTLDRLMVDYNNGVAFRFTDCQSIRADSLCASIVRRELVVLERVSDSVFSQVRAINLGGVTDTDVKEAVRLDGCQKLTLSNWTVQETSLDAVVLRQSSDIQFVNLLCAKNAGRAYVEEAGCDRNLVQGLMAYDNNPTVCVVQSGPASVIKGLVTSSGQRHESVTGAFSA